jgi:hypothetical protein
VHNWLAAAASRPKAGETGYASCIKNFRGAVFVANHCLPMAWDKKSAIFVMHFMQERA